MFTTFLVFLLLLVDAPQETAGRFLERMGETLLGVVIAVVFGLAVPAVLAADTARRPSREHRRCPGRLVPLYPLQMVANLLVFGLLLRIVIRAVRVNRDHRHGADPQD